MDKKVIAKKMAVIYGFPFKFITDHLLVSVNNDKYYDSSPEYIFYFDKKPIKINSSEMKLNSISVGYYTRKSHGAWTIYDLMDKAQSEKYYDIEWIFGKRFKVTNFLDF